MIQELSERFFAKHEDLNFLIADDTLRETTFLQMPTSLTEPFVRAQPGSRPSGSSTVDHPSSAIVAPRRY